MSAVASVQPSSLEVAPEAQSHWSRGRPNAGPKLGDLHYPRLLTIFNTIVLDGILDGRPWCSPLLCLDGNSDERHWVHTQAGRVRISPADRVRLFSPPT